MSCCCNSQDLVRALDPASAAGFAAHRTVAGKYIELAAYQQLQGSVAFYTTGLSSQLLRAVHTMNVDWTPPDVL